MTSRWKDAVLVAVVVTGSAVCVRLGMWQLRRLEERRAQNAELLRNRAAPPFELRSRTDFAGAGRDRRVRARGTWLWGAERVWPGRDWNGVPGVAVLTPLRLADGSVVFVDRGWLPSRDARHVDLTTAREPDTAAVQGLAIPVPRDRWDVAPVVQAESLGVAVAPFIVLLDSTVPSPRDGPFRWHTPELSDGPHLGYAIQWFSFATIALVGTAVLLRRRRREAAAASPSGARLSGRD